MPPSLGGSSRGVSTRRPCSAAAPRSSPAAAGSERRLPRAPPGRLRGVRPRARAPPPSRRRSRCESEPRAAQRYSRGGRLTEGKDQLAGVEQQRSTVLGTRFDQRHRPFTRLGEVRRRLELDRGLALVVDGRRARRRSRRPRRTGGPCSWSAATPPRSDAGRQTSLQRYGVDPAGERRRHRRLVDRLRRASQAHAIRQGSLIAASPPGSRTGQSSPTRS